MKSSSSPADSTANDSDSDAPLSAVNGNSPTAEKKETSDEKDETEPTRKKRATFVVTVHGPHKIKIKRNFRCKKCDFTAGKVKELNAHYRESHEPHSCPVCNKGFSNPDNLRKHQAQHTVNKFACRSCDKTFPYESKLAEHRVSHMRLGYKKCFHGKCTKIFKRKSDLEKHAITHSNKLHKCNKCNYANADIRNLKQHQRKHAEVGAYACPKCGKRFVYHIQKTRHMKNVCK